MLFPGINESQGFGIAVVLLFSSIGAAITPQIGASRTTGVAPLAVFVDATATAGLDGGDYVNANFDWNFDRDGVDAAGRYTITRGFVAAHVYENPGTYTIQLTVHDRLGATAVATTQVVVTAFSGTTYFVATDGSNAAAGTSMAAPLATADYAILQKGGPNTRILLRRGDRFTVPAITVSKTGPMTVGSYSDPDSPSSVLPMLYCTTDGWGILNVSGASDCRFMDIHLRSSFSAINNANTSPNQGAGGTNPNCSNTLFLRMEVDSVGRFGFGGNGRNTFIFDCYYHDYGTYGCYADSLDHFAMVGVVSRNLKGGQHFFRSQGGSKAFIAYNDINQSSANFDNITCRGSTSQAYVLGNRLDLNIGIYPQYSGAVEYQRYCVTDGNLLRNGGIGVAAKHIAIRNNLLNGGGISLRSYPTVGISDTITISNNSCYTRSGSDLVSGSATSAVIKNNIFYTDTTINYASGMSLSGTLTNYQVDNNLYYGPRLTRALSFGGGGFGGWQGQGFDVHGKVTNPFFVSTDPASPDFLTLGASSPAIGAGAIVGSTGPVFVDFAGNLRPVGLATDIGARLYLMQAVSQSGKARPLHGKIDVACRDMGNGMVDFAVSMKQPGSFHLDVYDMKGRRVWWYAKENAVAGFHQVRFAQGCGKGILSNGTYVLALKQAGMQVNHKIAVAR